VEGNSLNFEVEIDQMYPIDIILTMGFELITTSAADFDTATFDITIPAGSTNMEFSVQTFNDTEVEDNEVFLVTIRSVQQGVIANINVTASGTIIDNITPQGDMDLENIVVYPVPLMNGNTVVVSDIANGSYNLKLFKVGGAIVSSKDIEINNFSYEFAIPSNVSNGMYYIVLYSLNEDKRFSKALVIAR